MRQITVHTLKVGRLTVDTRAMFNLFTESIARAWDCYPIKVLVLATVTIAPIIALLSFAVSAIK